MALIVLEQKMIDIETLSKSINTLLGNNFIIHIEDGRAIPFCFKLAHFHHLLGLHYLDDMPDIKNAKNKSGLVKKLLKDPRLFSRIQRSSHFEKIRDRIEKFPIIVDMLISDRCKIIIDFDKSLLPATSIKSEFLLYKTEDYKCYHILGIASVKNFYYPETFLVENSKYYVTGQKFLNCTIERIAFKLK